MWELNNQDIVIILSVLSGCLVFYNLWGYFIAIVILIIATIYTCIYVVINDNYNTLLARINDSIIKAGNNIPDLLSQFYHQLLTYFREFSDFLKNLYKKHVGKMERRGRNSYQLSSESSVSMSHNPQLGLINNLSPISRTTRRSIVSGSENSAAKNFSPSSSFGGKQWENSNYNLNGDVNGSMVNLWKKSHNKYDNNTHDDSPSARREEILFRSHSTPWNAGLSPKINSNSGIKTVQTVAGPLLSSSRYNIDSKVYSNSSSPGLGSKLTKYASDADTKLLYQSQYTAGQFPKVNLYCSPTPTINAKTVKARSPVTVRIAPPETIKYSPPEKEKIFAGIYRSDKKSPSVVQVLKEISLKRHASMDDVSAELVKKQRTDDSQSEEYESFDEVTQKRTREDLSRSDEDISIENTSLRPVKRTKIPSCYDILNSLSSSTNVVTSSGVKRKADLSRSGTPEVGKHFKSFDNNRRSNSLSPRVPADQSTSKTALNRSNLNSEVLNVMDGISYKKQGSVSPKQIYQQSSPISSKNNSNNNNSTNISSGNKINSNKNIKLVTENAQTKLKDKLFMRAEPQNIDKIKTLIEEHDVTGKFSGDDADEIKQSDITTMRQTSMKARLKSMFDAISGKVSGEIDPSVVIQADTVNERSSAVTSTESTPAVLASLNSSTSTTTVNTSPIATSAIKPIIGKVKDSSTPVKHVTFNLSAGGTSTTNSTSLNVSSSAAPSLLDKSDNADKSFVATSKPFVQQNTPAVTSSFSFTPAATAAATPVTSNPATVSSAAPSFSLLTQTPASTAAIQPAAQKTESIISSSFNLSTQATSTSTSVGFSFGKTGTETATSTPNLLVSPKSLTTAPSQLKLSSVATTSSNTFSSNPTPASTPAFSFGTNSSTGNTVFSFGNTSSPTSSAQQKTPQDNTAPAFSTKPTASATSTPSLFSFTPNTISTSAATTAASTAADKPSATPGSTSGFSFGATNAKPSFSFGNTSAPQVTASTPLTFGSTSQPTAVFGSPATTNTQATSSFSAAPAATTSQTAATTGSLPSIFGSNANTQSSFSSPASTANTKPSILSFGAPKTTEVTSFGSNNATTTASSIFNNSNQTSTASSLMFGGNNNSNTNNNTTSNNNNNNNNSNNIFGQTKLPSFGSQSSLNFGTNSNSTFGNNSTMTFGSQQPTTTASFGTTTSTTNSTTAPTFGSSNIASPSFGSSGGTSSTSSTVFPSFSNSNTSFGTQNKNSSAVFGSTATTTSSAAAAPPPFGATPTTAPPAFGATTTATQAFGSSSTTTAPPTFGSSSSSTSAFGGSSSISAFGASTTATPSFGTSTTKAPPAFGATTTAPPAFGSTTTPVFGSTTAPAFGSTAAPPAFGATTAAPPAFGATTSAPPAFGATTTAPPAFGSTTTATPSFGTSTTLPSFGASAAPPAFGAASTSAKPTFGTSTAPPSFGSSSTSAPPAFGASTGFGSSSLSTPAFGSSTTSFTGFGSNSTPSPFTPPTPSFGSTSANNNNTNNTASNNNNSSTFAFGNTSQPAAAQNPVFSFGGPGPGTGSGTSSAGSASTPFQFGNAGTSTGGFNFNSGSSLAGSFNTGNNAAGGGGMFSIGSGSTAPRSRPARSRRQQR